MTSGAIAEVLDTVSPTNAQTIWSMPDMPRHNPITLEKPVPGTAFGLVVPGCHVLAAELPRPRLALGMSHALEVMFPIPERYGARRGWSTRISTHLSLGPVRPTLRT